MRRTCWTMAALTFLVLGPGTPGVRDARAQWVEVSRARYGLFGRPRAVETYWVPGADVVRTAYVGPTSYVIDAPVVATSYVETTPTALVIPTRYVSAVPAFIPTTYVNTFSYPVVATGYLPAAPVVRAYVPTARAIETRAIIVP